MKKDNNNSKPFQFSLIYLNKINNICLAVFSNSWIPWMGENEEEKSKENERIETEEKELIEKENEETKCQSEE